MAWVLNHSPTTGTDKLVLLGIANHADEYGENAWPSIPTLARYAGVTERNARHAVRRLEDAGEIATEERRGGRVDSDPRYRTNRYTLVRFRGVASDRAANPGGSESVVRGVAERHSGGSPATGKPSFNRPEPPAGFSHKIDKALGIAARSGAGAPIKVLRERHRDTLARYCATWPDIAAEQLAHYVVTGALPQSVAALEKAS